MSKVVLRSVADICQWRGGVGNAIFANGEIAVDAIACATAEELLAAFGSSPNARQIVELLLDERLTFDNTIEHHLRAEGFDDAR